MIVDSSALLAIVFRERGYERLLVALAKSEHRGVGAPTLAETGIVLAARLGEASRALLSQLLEILEIDVLPFTASHWREAREAYLRFGRGRHKANLNFGDCLTYAVAKLSGRPLLFVGNDFARTDVEAVVVR